MNLSKPTAFAVLLAAGAMPALAQRSVQSDRNFVTNAVEVSNSEVLLARIAGQQSNSPDVKQFAQHVLGEHTQLGQAVAPLAQQVSASLTPGETSAGQKHAIARLQTFSGAAFDREYIHNQIAELSYALHVYQSEIATTQDPGLKQTAVVGAKVVAAHLRQAEQLAQVRQTPLSARPQTMPVRAATR
ncbi:MAG TPA: DUF4142 domain-containing protein [Acidobacteriaceae bacterium]|nr:DUF4142 domain-containing protein [Acidobacteriaceae bacterium]